PSSYALFLEADPSEREADVLHSGRKLRVAVAPSVPLGALRPGQEVRLNEALVLVRGAGYERTGELVAVKEVLDDARVLVVARSDDERVLRLAGPLAQVRVRVGDTLLADLRAGFAVEQVERSEVAELVLEEVPDVEYADIGGPGPPTEQSPAPLRS